MSKTPNPMPEEKMDAQLAEENSFFIRFQKIKTSIPKH